MQTLAQLNLPHLAVEDAAFAADPVSHFREARKTNPWIAASDIGYWVHDYQAIRDLLSQDDKFRPAYDGIVEIMGARGTPWGRFTEEQLISLPPEQHAALRTTFARKFTPRFANQLRPMMRETITRMLDEWAPRERFDFEEFAANFPITIMFTLVGAPVEEIPGIRSSLETLGLAFSMDKSRIPEIHEGYERLERLVQRIIAERRASPDKGTRGDLLDLLIETGDEGNVPERQLQDLVIFFFVAGYDTSKNVLTYTLRLLLDRPDLYERCARDHEYCRKVLDESLRLFNPGSVPRFTDQDVVYRDVLIPKDTMIWFTLNISGRDETAFEDADTFDPDREIDPATRPIPFSLGKHMCLGQHIARAQLQEALHQIAQRLHDPQLAGEYGWRPYPGAWGLKGLPIAFTPTDKTPEPA
ncbi:cytochrome P450 [Novosphingobium chloroacetimidivorans]|uniref:Cytochrome P450 n=1 Tax=Novosphingobium chloroacetimidivorans TaxID=1428314 RepID=A0A7W7KB17_9SPHN|nr:cytochrome P450 [Novosphingobium chloroacetimidivorans]MBB4858883.1 cytochrome P450 [Novosphingobium chloroacetimidivorans]